MKISLVLLLGLISVPVLDYAVAGFDRSVADSALAYGYGGVSRTAFAVRGPYGGGAVGVRRTAFGGRGYYFRSLTSAANKVTEDKANSPELNPKSSIQERLAIDTSAYKGK